MPSRTKFITICVELTHNPGNNRMLCRHSYFAIQRTEINFLRCGPTSWPQKECPPLDPKHLLPSCKVIFEENDAVHNLIFPRFHRTSWFFLVGYTGLGCKLPPPGPHFSKKKSWWGGGDFCRFWSLKVCQPQAHPSKGLCLDIYYTHIWTKSCWYMLFSDWESQNTNKIATFFFSSPTFFVLFV